MRIPGRFLCTAAIVVVSVLAFGSSPGGAQAAPSTLETIARFRDEAWHWQRLLGRRLTPYTRFVEADVTEEYRQWVLGLWRARAVQLRIAVRRPPRFSAWICIHRREGPWKANTGNGYYGGLQMDITFQRTYGLFLLRKKGRAHRWTPLEQIWTAERAYRSGRGFRPWPNTARRCGVL